MRNRLSPGRIGLPVVIAIVIVLATPTGAFAAIEATLTSAHARPGDTVLLLTDDHGGSWQYQQLSGENHQSIYLAPTTGEFAQGCGGLGSQLVAKLDWRRNAGGALFVVPSLPFGDYWLFMQTAGQCWRIGSSTGSSAGILLLSVGSTPADNQELAKRWTPDLLAPPPGSASKPSAIHPRSSPVLPVGLAIIIGTALIGSILWRRARSRRRG